MRLVCVVVLFACFGSHTWAQDTAETPVDPAVDSAREWYEAGVDLYNREEYGAALDAFRRAFRLVPRPQLYFNMAQCLSKLGRHREAVEELTQAIASGELTELESRRARAELLVEEENLGVLRVTGSGVVTVDGEACELPCELRLDAGEHQIEHDGNVRAVRLRAGDQTRVALEEEQSTPTVRGPYRPGVGTIVGAGLLAVGAAGTVGFGLRTRSLEDDFDAAPSESLADDGERAKLLTNLSIGVAVVGALVWFIEIIVMSRRERPASERATTSVSPRAW